MPEFPRYQSKGQLTTQQPSVMAPEDTSYKLTEAAGQISAQAQDIAVKWGAAVDQIQTTTAKANFKERVLDIENRAVNDPDPNNSEQYLKEIEKAKAESLKGFSSKAAEASAAVDLNYDAKVSGIKIQNAYRKKMIDVGQTSTLRLLDMEASKPGPDLESRVEGVLEDPSRVGLFSEKEKYNLQKKYVKKGKFNSFLGDMQSSLKRTSDSLTKNEYGFDVKELKDAWSIYDSEENKIQAANQSQLIDDYLTDPSQVSEEGVKQMMDQNNITPEFAESMISKINNPKPDKPSQDKAYIEFQNMVTDMQGKGDKAEIKEIVKLMTNTMKAHAEGLLDTSDVKRILKDRNVLLQSKLEDEATDILKEKNPKTFMEHLTFWSDEYAEKRPEIKARMYRKLVDGMLQGQDPDALVTKIIDDEFDRKLSEIREEPNKVYAKDPDTGERVAYSEDGGDTWTDIKTGKERK